MILFNSFNKKKSSISSIKNIVDLKMIDPKIRHHQQHTVNAKKKKFFVLFFKCFLHAFT